MRIGIDARVLSDRLSGEGRYAYNLIRAIAEVDDENEYVVLVDPGRFTGRIVKSGHRFREMPLTIRRFSLQEQLVLPNLLKRESLDLFHSLHHILPLGYNGLMIVTIHDTLAARFPWHFSHFPFLKRLAAFWYFKVFVYLSAMRANGIVVDSKRTADDLCQYLNISRQKIVVCRLGVENHFAPIKDTKYVREKYSLRAPFILYLGNFRPYKNLERLFQAFAQFVESSTDQRYQLIIGGNDVEFYKRRLRQQVDKLHLEEKVIFLGYVDEDDMPALLSCAELFVFPSLYEGFGLPPLEAMACGTPVLVSNTTPLPEIVGDAGLLVDPYDVNAISAALQRALTDTNLRKRLARKGLERSQQFSWTQTARKMLAVYEQIADLRSKCL